MCFEIIFATNPSIYPLVHEIQVVQPRYSAENLGPPIAIGKKQNLSVYSTQSQINPVYQLQFNSETLSEGNLLNPLVSAQFNEIEPKFDQIDLISIKPTQSPINLVTPLPFNPENLSKGNLLNPLVRAQFNEIEPNCQIDSVSINPNQSPIKLVAPLQFNLETLFEENSPNSGMSVKLKEIESKFGQIDSVSTDIKIGSVKSKLELDSQDLKSELTLLSKSGFRVKITGKLQNSDQELEIGPVVSFKKSLNWFQEQSKNEPEDKKVFLDQATRFTSPIRLSPNSVYLNSLRINQENEIDDSSKNIRSLTKSLNSLATSQFATNTTYSFEEDLEELSAKLKFPVPGILRDELQLKIKTNLPDVMVHGENLQDNMKSTLSLRYRIGINDAIKLEIQSSYNLRTTTTTDKIMFELF